MSARASSNRYRSGLAALAIAGVAIGALLLAGPLEAGSSTLPAGNLVQNPGGEADVGANDSNTTVAPQGWVTTGTFSAVRYGAPDFLTTAFAAQIGGGSNFLSGGRNAPVSTATQVIDVSGSTTEIDAGGVQAKLSAYLGGYTSQKDAGMADAVFLSATDAQLGSVRVGPVGPTDRQGKTTLLVRSATGDVPKGTTKIKVVLTSTRADGTYNDGYFDNIALELGHRPAAREANAHRRLLGQGAGRDASADRPNQGHVGGVPRQRQGDRSRHQGAVRAALQGIRAPGTAEGDRSCPSRRKSHSDHQDGPAMLTGTDSRCTSPTRRTVAGNPGPRRATDEERQRWRRLISPLGCATAALGANRRPRTPRRPRLGEPVRPSRGLAWSFPEFGKKGNQWKLSARGVPCQFAHRRGRRSSSARPVLG